MKAVLSWLIVGAVAIGVLLLRFSCVHGGVQNYVPTHLHFRAVDSPWAIGSRCLGEAALQSRW